MIRSYPFGKEDATEIMVSEVAREAEAQGCPLTEAERSELSQDVNPKDDDVPGYQRRVYELIKVVIEKEMADPALKDWRTRSFVNAIEWATDMNYPLVGHLAIIAFDERRGKLPQPKRKHSVVDRLLLVLTGIGVFIGMIFIVNIASRLSQR